MVRFIERAARQPKFPFLPGYSTVFGGSEYKRAKTLEDAIRIAEGFKPPMSTPSRRGEKKKIIPIQSRWVEDTKGNVIWRDGSMVNEGRSSMNRRDIGRDFRDGVRQSRRMTSRRRNDIERSERRDVSRGGMKTPEGYGYSIEDMHRVFKRYLGFRSNARSPEDLIDDFFEFAYDEGAKSDR